MAFAAVSCFVETLEDLLRFTFLALDIKDLQIKIEDGDRSENFIKGSMQKAAEVLLMPMSSLLRMPMPSTQRYRRLSVIAGEISKFHKVLLFMLTNLKGSANITHDDEKMQYLERRLKDLAYRIGDMIEETIIDRSVILNAFNFISALVNNTDPMLVMRDHSFMSQVSDMFDKAYVLHFSLQRTFSEISFINEEMKMIYDGAPIVNADLQSSKKSVVEDSLQHMTTKKDQFFDANDGFMSILDRVIRDSSPLELVAIVGMGGIGKTTLAQRIFDYPLTCHHFYIRAWVVVSQAWFAVAVSVAVSEGIVPYRSRNIG